MKEGVLSVKNFLAVLSLISERNAINQRREDAREHTDAANPIRKSTINREGNVV